MSATITNTDANINAKTVMAAENAETVTGLKTFDRDPNPPFAVAAGSAVVPNLDADKLDGLEATDFIKKDGSVSLTGKLNTGTIGQIQFPASQNASTDVNCLDDYEEGTFVPTIVSSGGGTPTYSFQSGYYIKIGKGIMFQGRVTLATSGTLAAGALTIAGLPLAALGTAGYLGTVTIHYWAGMSGTNVVYMSGTIAASSQAITIRHAAGTAAALSTTQVSDASSTLDLIFSGYYQAAA